jgi:hypothetical protein
MEKSWIAVFVVWIIAHILYITYGLYGSVIRLVVHILVGLVFLVTMYKTFKKPIPLSSKHIRKDKKYILKRLKEVLKLGYMLQVVVLV